MNKSYYTTPQPSAIMRALWKACGADKNILERSTYSDHVKYACLGGIVVATGAMAMLAGGYAFYTIFEPKGSALDSILISDMGVNVSNLSEEVKKSMEIAKTNYLHIPTVIKSCLFGFIWGLIIFNIDRFIVTSTGKGDGTEAITWQEFKSAIPRILMGMIIALTISKPIEIRMFKTEIDIRLHEKQLEKKKDYENKINANYVERLGTVQKEFDKLEDERNDLKERIKKAEIEYTDQLQGRAGAPAGDGKLSQALEKQKNNLINELNAFDSSHSVQRKKLELRIDSLQKEKNLELQKGDIVAAGLDGLLERISIVGDPHIVNPLISIFITLLFMAIELTPIFFKLMLVKSPYDYLEQNIKELIKAEEGIEVQYDFYQDKQGIEKDLVTHHKAELLLHEKMKLIEAQKELSIVIIDKWKEKERKNIGEDPDSYITKG